MDAFKLLEEKISKLLELLSEAKKTITALTQEKEQLTLDSVHVLEEKRALTEEKQLLAEENAQLHERLQDLELALLKDTERIDQLDQEKTVTKLIIDDLIKSIDSCVEVDNQ